MVFSCCSFHPKSSKTESPSYQLDLLKYKERNARITAFVLGVVSLFLFSVGCVLLGLGSQSPTFLNGLGIFPYFAGIFFSLVALGVLCGTAICSVRAGVHFYQKKQL